MTLIYTYIGRFFGCGLLFTAVYLLFRRIHIKRKDIAANKNDEILKVVFVCFLCGAVSQTIFPIADLIWVGDEFRLSFIAPYGNLFVYTGGGGIQYDSKYVFSELPRQLNLVPFRTITMYSSGEIESFYGHAWKTEAILNILGNFCLFFPIGFLLPLAFKRFRRFWKTFLLGFGMIVAIEGIQYVIGRTADIDDLIVNLFGIVCGYAWLQNCVDTACAAVRRKNPCRRKGNAEKNEAAAQKEKASRLREQVLP